MEIILNPEKNTWSSILQRPGPQMETMDNEIAVIMKAVKTEGDRALIRFAKTFDKVALEHLYVTADEIAKARSDIDAPLKSAIEVAIRNIEKFHRQQLIEEKKVETSPGVICWRKNIPIEKVGFYIPGGNAPLFSTVIMLAVPAAIAGCSEIILCTPPDQNGGIHPAILYTAGRLGIKKIFKVGGAQAIAAMAYGTGTVPGVYKIFGPGNPYVTAAKMRVSMEGVAIDMPAGPSEVLVLADQSANPSFIAADLLSQAEHGVDSQVLLITDQMETIKAVQAAVEKQLLQLPRHDLINSSLGNSKMILIEDLDIGIDMINEYAPEHLILMVKDPDQVSDKIINAGSVFLGNYSPESAGDYASGTNHVLATNGFARSFSGVSVDCFLKKITYQKISPRGLQEIGPAIEIMAESEQLMAHKQAVSIRLEQLKRENNEN